MANFVHIKYRPKTLQTFNILHDVKNKLLRLSNNKDLTNTILYGKNGCCKKTLLLCYLNNYFNNSNEIYNTQIINFTLSNNYSYFYKVSSKHFEFTLIDNYNINKLIIIEVLYSLIKTKSIINDNTIIIINNIDKLSLYFKMLQDIIEKYKNIIILGTSSKYIYNSISFMQLNCNIMNYFDLLKLSLQIKNNYNININNNTIKEYIYESNFDINILLNIYQHIINKSIISKNKLTDVIKNNTNNNHINNIVTILYNKNIDDFPKIKNILNTILIYKSYSISNIINYIYSKIINIIIDKHNFIYDYSSLTDKINYNNDTQNIILLDTIILCIYKYI